MRHPFTFPSGSHRALAAQWLAWNWFGPIQCTSKRRAYRRLLADV